MSKNSYESGQLESKRSDGKLLNATTKSYEEVPLNPSFPDIENSILEKWKRENTFNSSIRGKEDYVFFDGPPFANGLPHPGHLLTGNIKDLYARFQTQCGKRVERRFGWDCHGLPAEMSVEKKLGISGKKAIKEFGISKFNEECRSEVLRYTNEWQDYVTRQGRWVDFENDYKTMDLSYMESVIWAFKELHKKGLIYKSMRVMPYSWAAETPVSDFETRIDNSYREKTSKSVTVLFNLKDEIAGHKDVKILAWTTTPWTLPSNLALAVGEEIEYVIVQNQSVDKNQKILVAKELLDNFDITGDIIATVTGAELRGKSYKPLFPYFESRQNAFQILTAEFVTTTDGTGIVHIAPGFGEDDYELCKQASIEVACPVDDAGCFTNEITDFAGMQVFDANDDIIKHLKKNGNWFKTEQYLHNYPHCWRTDKPLIYRAMPSWYVKVTEIKDKMIANNQQINWIPSHIKDGLFGKWLENARDWSISRNRFWGCPIPVWESDDPRYPHTEIYGSIAEIEASFNVRVESLHRPEIDKLTKPNPSDPTGKSMLKRVPDVLDCWFESGSMPYAQLHYPFENQEKFEKNFPADFIVEYVAQTRGWFYTLLVLSSALFNRPPFLNCICHGVILGDGGQKLSKRLKNYSDPNEIFTKYGADALRWYMMSSPVVRGKEIILDNNGVIEAQKSVIKPMWNAYNFYVLYANADKIKAKLIDTEKFSEESASENIMDRYIIAKVTEMANIVRASLDSYDSTDATAAIESFLDVLNNWYIRRNRERFWRREKDQDKLGAYNTLYTVLNILLKCAAPLLPMITESIYCGLDYEENSVHLTSFPNAQAFDKSLIQDMDRVRDACNTALSIRNDTGIRTRQPLQSVTFIGVTSDNFTDELKQQILQEINVKNWVNLEKESIDKYASYKLKIIFKELGKRLPGSVKQVIEANKKSEWQIGNSQNVVIAGIELQPNEYVLQLEPKDIVDAASGNIASDAGSRNNIKPLSTNDALVMLDTNITQELEMEGIARDVIRQIQQYRKDENFDVSDSIKISLKPNSDLILNVLNKWKDHIELQTLSIISVQGVDNMLQSVVDIQKVEK